MLILAGLGLWDEKDLTLRIIEEGKKCDKIYLELYTGIWKGKIERLEEMFGKRIIRVDREFLEGKSKEIIEESKNKRIMILTQGDPLVLTTHYSLILEAKKAKVKTKILHNASIICGITDCGLHIQKFGKYVTIPFLQKTKGVLPQSVYETIEMNKKNGLHTLCFLDLIAEEKLFMEVREGLKILLDLEKKYRRDMIKEEEKIVVMTKVGSQEQKIVWGEIKKLKEMEFGAPAILIIPGSLHFTEKEALEHFSL